SERSQPGGHAQRQAVLPEAVAGLGTAEAAMTTFPTLFSPLRLGARTVKNRICCSAHADALAEDGMPTERTVRYYELKARGGTGLIMCFGSASVHPTSPARDWNGVEPFDDRGVPPLRGFAR